MTNNKTDLTKKLRRNIRSMNNSTDQQKQDESQEQNEPQTSDPHTNISDPPLPSEHLKNISKSKKKKVGRPKIKTEPEKTINISIPVSVLKKMNIAKLKYDNNLTKYVNAVIKEDLDRNFELYLKVQKLINS